MAAEKAILCVLCEEFSEPDEVGINMCLLLPEHQRTSQSGEGICGI